MKVAASEIVIAHPPPVCPPQGGIKALWAEIGDFFFSPLGGKKKRDSFRKMYSNRPKKV